MKPSLEKRMLRKLQPMTELVLWIHGEHAHLTNQQVRQKIAMITTTLAIAKAMLNDEPPPPNDEPQGGSDGQTEIPFAKGS